MTKKAIRIGCLARLRLWIRRIDWRVQAIIATLFILLVVTGSAYYFGIGINPATHFGAVFAAWVAGLALFVVSGTVVAVVSLARPEHESFDARARILLRRKSGPHIDYIISRISHILEHYSENTTTVVTLRSYNTDTLMYRVGLEQHILYVVT